MAEPLRRERKKAALRQRILAEARQLIVRKGYWATKVEEIAEAADVAPATFFNYFPGKSALLAALASWLNDPRYPLGIRMDQVGGFVTDALSPTAPHHTSQTAHKHTTGGDHHASCNDDHRRPRREW